jgi:hypothetical protein
MDLKKLSDYIKSLTIQLEDLKKKNVAPEELERITADLKSLKETLDYLLTSSK